MTTENAIVTTEMDLVAPVDAEHILEAFKKFEWLKRNVIGPDDRQKIGNTSFIKKSGWLKVALSCNISLEKREERVEQEGDDTIYHYTYRAIAPTGRFADADGSASSAERTFTHMPHDLRTLAQTRACNRAISNLAGGGEISAEEMSNTPKKTISKSKGKKNALDEVILKKGQTWNKIFKKFGPEIQTRQEQLQLNGEIWTFDSAAVVFAREKGFVQGLPQ